MALLRTLFHFHTLSLIIIVVFLIVRSARRAILFEEGGGFEARTVGG